MGLCGRNSSQSSAPSYSYDGDRDRDPGAFSTESARHSENRPYPLMSSFPRPSFPQDTGGVLRSKPLRRTAQDHDAAADNLLSLVHVGRRSCGAPTNVLDSVRHQRRREEHGNLSKSQLPPTTAEGFVGRGRKRLEPMRMKSSGRPARAIAKDEGDQPTRKRRDKKPTYVVRREKKAMLESEIVLLKQHMLLLRRASGVPDSFFVDKEQLIARIQDNDRLRVEFRKQDMVLRNAHAIISAEYLMECPESPIETFVHLTRNLKQRKAELVRLKEIKLAQADAFITERSKFLPRLTPWSQESKFETKEGHYCAEKMDNTPFHGARSVRQVFEALQFFLQNMEFDISEVLEDTTVCGDDGTTTSSSLSNHRLVCTMVHGVKVEKNILKFFNLVESGAEDNYEASASYALVATDSVDVDDVYPYVPQERVRMDINSAMKLTQHFKMKPANQNKIRTRHLLYGDGGFPYPRDPEDEEKDDEFERVVVLTRFFRVKLHHTEMDIPPHVLQEVRQGLTHFSDAMAQSIHRVIYDVSIPGEEH